MSQMTFVTPAPTGVRAQFFGSSGGATTRYYWVQAIYPSGTSAISGAPVVTCLANLDNNNRVLVEWNPMAGAIGYNVFYTTTSTAPTQGAIFLNTVSKASFSDQGISNSPGTSQVIVGAGIMVARAQYNFANDGGAIGAITLSLADTLPAGAVLCGGYVNPTTALTSGGSATISIGVSAGLSSPGAALKALTAVASYSIDALLPLIPVFATPLKMTAAGTLNITVAVATLTAGIMDIFVFYTMPIAL